MTYFSTEMWFFCCTLASLMILQGADAFPVRNGLIARQQGPPTGNTFPTTSTATPFLVLLLLLFNTNACLGPCCSSRACSFNTYRTSTLCLPPQTFWSKTYSGPCQSNSGTRAKKKSSSGLACRTTRRRITELYNASNNG